MKQLNKWIPVLAALLGFLILSMPQTVSAQGASACSQASNCSEEFDVPGSYTVPTYITEFRIKAGQTTIVIDPADGDYNDGCYLVQFSASETGGDIDTAHWEELFDEDNNPNQCQNISNVEVWWYESPTAVTFVGASAKTSTAGLIAMLALAFTLGFLTFAVWWGFKGRHWWARRRLSH